MRNGQIESNSTKKEISPVDTIKTTNYVKDKSNESNSNIEELISQNRELKKLILKVNYIFFNYF